MEFSKYHGLGNDYIVIDPHGRRDAMLPDQIRRICHRNYGVGSDGILLGPLPSGTCDFQLKIFNPDGSEAEKSGNGLRIFARYLWDMNRVTDRAFTVDTLGGAVTCEVKDAGRTVTVDMGAVRFDSTAIPVTGPPREVLYESMTIDDQTFDFCAATVGNPHCVILSADPTPALACRYGPIIEVNSRFPNRTNVQFMSVINRANIRIEIWERGAGYTLASGSSSTAAAGVAYRLGLCDEAITVHMPGGTIDLRFSDGFQATMTGPVVKVCDGVIAEEMFE